jgi:hypothetical protein
MSIAIRIALALELLLICSEAVCRPLGAYLPLGGSQIAQVGASLGIAVVIAELWSAWEEILAGLKKRDEEKSRTSSSPAASQ